MSFKLVLALWNSWLCSYAEHIFSYLVHNVTAAASFICSTPHVPTDHWLIETWLSFVIWQLLSNPDQSWPIIACHLFLRWGKVQEPLLTFGRVDWLHHHSEPVCVKTRLGGRGRGFRWYDLALGKAWSEAHKVMSPPRPRWWCAQRAWSWSSWTMTCRRTGFCDWDGHACWPCTGCACWRWWSLWWTFCSPHRSPWWPNPQWAPWAGLAHPATGHLCCCCYCCALRTWGWKEIMN